jgi:hypothetical protein
MDETRVGEWVANGAQELPPMFCACDGYEHYAVWCERRGFEVLALPTWGKIMSTTFATHFERTKVQGRVCYRRVRPQLRQ